MKFQETQLFKTKVIRQQIFLIPDSLYETSRFGGRDNHHHWRRNYAAKVISRRKINFRYLDSMKFVDLIVEWKFGFNASSTK